MFERRQRTPLPQGFSVLWVTVVIDAIGFGIVVPILPLYARDFGASAAAVGFILASFSLAQLVFSPVLGRLSDRVGRRPVLIISLFGTAVGSLLTGLAGSLPLLYIGRVVDGASGASVTVARASVADLATDPKERPRLFGLLGAALGLGFVIGPAIGALAALGDHRLPFYLAALIAAVNGVVAIVRLPETRPEAVTDPAATSGAAGQDAATVSSEADAGGVPLTARPEAASPFRRLIVVSFASMAAFAGFEVGFPLLGEERLGLGIAGMGLVFAALGLALVIVRIGIVGPFTEQVGEAMAVRVGLVLNAAGLLLFVPDGGWAFVVVALGLLVAGQGLLMPVLSSAIAGLAPHGAAGAPLGFQQSANSLARILGPAAAGVLFAVSLGLPFIGAAALSLVALAVVPSGDTLADLSASQPD